MEFKFERISGLMTNVPHDEEYITGALLEAAYTIDDGEQEFDHVTADNRKALLADIAHYGFSDGYEAQWIKLHLSKDDITLVWEKK